MRQSIKFYVSTALGLAMTQAVLPQVSWAQTGGDQHDEIIVTGARISQGGAQDIKHFRGQIDIGEIPRPGGFTSEGLLSEHDLYLSGHSECTQLLCLNGAVMPARITPGTYFAGLGFDTNISDDWQRAPLNLVAIIDRSGSMGGDKIENVKRSLYEIIDELGDDDQISFVLYGSDVVTHLEPMIISASNKSLIREKIDSIHIEGSTNMDLGLARGYEIAQTTQDDFIGSTRLMIFTDERPNTGRTDAEGFMARANAASHKGIGLTTIGYGVNYGGELAAKIASVRGGNLFYVSDQEDVKTLFSEDFDFMVSEIAHDLNISVMPSQGLSVGEVFGVPENLFTRHEDGSIEMSIGTVFLSSHGGGLFFSLYGEKSDDTGNMFSAALDYTSKNVLKTSDLTTSINNETSRNLIKADALSAQYSATKRATTAYHEGEKEEAFDVFNDFAKRFENSNIDGLTDEYELVATLNERFAIEAGRVSDLENPPKYASLYGLWEVSNARNMLDVHRGDRMKFSTDFYMEHYRKSVSLENPDDSERFSINEKQIYLTKSDLTFAYQVRKNGTIALRHRDGESVIYLKPVNPDL